MIGSSPLTRGILNVNLYQINADRFIPAHANTPCLLSDVQVLEVHPRSRGEYSISSGTVASQLGSSPLTRGILLFIFGGAFYDGFIPAHAGNTS